jgi:hypothetical protein
MTTYVLDPNRAEQIGMRPGFDDKDALEYYLFRGRGEWVGQIAQFEPFGDVGTKIALGNRNLPATKVSVSRLLARGGVQRHARHHSHQPADDAELRHS